MALLDSILGQVEEDCAAATPSAQDTDFARELMFAMSDSFRDEEARRNKFWGIARTEFGINIVPVTLRGSDSGSAMIPAGRIRALVQTWR